ncbi:MAG: type VI secretion system accessory protein TagJ [Planctomycetota bacterium]
MGWFNRSRDSETSDESPRRRMRRARDLLLQAEQTAAQGDVTHAEALLHEAVACDPELVRARLHLASLHLSRGEDIEASAQLAGVLARQDVPPEACHMGAVLAVRRGNLEEARRLVKRGLVGAEESPPLWSLAVEIARAATSRNLGPDSRSFRERARWAFEQVFTQPLLVRALDFEEPPDEAFVSSLDQADAALAERIRGLKDVLELFHRHECPDPRPVDISFRDGQRDTFTGLVDADPFTWANLECLQGDELVFIPFAKIREIVFEPAHAVVPAMVTMLEGGRRAVRIPCLYRYSSLSKNAAVARGAMTVWRNLAEGVDLVAGVRLLHTEESDFGIDTLRYLAFEG